MKKNIKDDIIRPLEIAWLQLFGKCCPLKTSEVIIFCQKVLKLQTCLVESSFYYQYQKYNKKLAIRMSSHSK